MEPERAALEDSVKLRNVERRCQSEQSATASVEAVAPLQYKIPMFLKLCQHFTYTLILSLFFRMPKSQHMHQFLQYNRNAGR